MAVIADARLIERRLETLRARREQLTAPAGSAQPLPPWAVDTLVAIGMTRAEIETIEAEQCAGVDDREGELIETDAAIEALERELVVRGEGSLEAVHGLAEIALARLRSTVPGSPDDLFYDAGQARAVELVARVVAGLERLRTGNMRRTG